MRVRSTHWGRAYRPAPNEVGRERSATRTPASGGGRRRGGGGSRRRVRPRVVEREQLLPVDRHVPRGFNAQPDLAPVDVHDRDADVVPDVNLFPELPAENQHFASLLLATRAVAVAECLRKHTPRPPAEAGGSRRFLSGLSPHPPVPRAIVLPSRASVTKRP